MAATVGVKQSANVAVVSSPVVQGRNNAQALRGGGIVKLPQSGT